jgi:murein DD-endopeptidase MepM/ murein hydrolase activator NlpD
MTELHPDRLLEGGAAPHQTTAGSSRKAPAASPDRRRAPAGTAAQHTAPQRRQGKTSPTGEAVHPAPAPCPRPTPYPRPAAGLEVRAVVVGDPGTRDDAEAAVAGAGPVTAVADAAELAVAADAQALTAVTAAAGTPHGDDAEPVPGPRGRRPASRAPRLPRRRPAWYLAAALVGAVGLGASTAGDRVARADGPEPVSASVSVAEELGLTGSDPSAAAEAATLRSDAVLLGEVTASRTAREAEEAAAAQAQAEADRVAAEAAAAAAAEAARPRTVLPVAGARLTSTFGSRWGKLHAGIDLAAPMLTPEYAAADGVVLEAGPASGYGNVVHIQHDNGDVTVYGHMEQILVQPGQVVRAGDTIALLGNRGQSTGPHLHFEVIVGGLGGQKVDPVPWLQERGVAV